MAETKVIITNESALKNKYPQQISKIQKALETYIKIDKTHNIETTIAYVDDAAFMAHIGNPVMNPQNQEQNKNAIDAIYNHYNPDYLLIIGSTDIIPHQELTNPITGGKIKDPDSNVPSDLPYASNTSYSKNIEDFRAPTRKVGRLPDITNTLVGGKKDPTYLIKLLTNKNRYKKYPYSNYQNYFGLSTSTWEDSTRLSLRNIFGNDKEIALSPPSIDTTWTKKQLQRYSHFINCHGSPKDIHYYGEKDYGGGKKEFPFSLNAYLIKGRIMDGNITAAECCYGAQLYDPDSLPHQGKDVLGMCNRYLSEGCVAFFGSSTISYGPSKGNSSADIITQYFIKNMIEGLSAGAACLKARQDFVTNEGLYGPINIKTLGQFNLMGDPSVQPVQLPLSHIFEEFLSLQTVSQIEKRDFERKAKYIAENIGWSTQKPESTPSPAVKDIISEIIQKEGIENSTLYTYVVKYPKDSEGDEERLEFPERVYLLMYQTELPYPLDTQIIAYTLKELNGQVYDVKREESKG